MTERAGDDPKTAAKSDGDAGSPLADAVDQPLGWWKRLSSSAQLWLRERLEVKDVGLGLFIWGLIGALVAFCVVAPWILFALSPVRAFHPAAYYGYLGAVVYFNVQIFLTFAFDRAVWRTRADRLLYAAVEVFVLAGIIAVFAATYFKLQRTTGCVQTPNVGAPGHMVPQHFSQFDAVYLTITTFTTVGSNAFAVLSEPCRVLVSVQTIAGLALIGAGIAAVVGHLTRRTADTRVGARAWELRKQIREERKVTAGDADEIQALLRSARVARRRDPVLPHLSLDKDENAPKGVSLTVDGASVLLRQVEIAMTRMWLDGRVWNLGATYIGPSAQALQAYSALRREALRKRTRAGWFHVPGAHDAAEEIKNLPDVQDKEFAAADIAAYVNKLDAILKQSLARRRSAGSSRGITSN